MARESGGGGAFGWTVLGILVGVAGTLAVETLLNNHQAREVNEEQAASSASAAVAAIPAPPKPAAVKALSAAVAQKSEATTLSQDDVEDDAAAAGMTSRSRPRDSQNSSALAGAAN